MAHATGVVAFDLDGTLIRHSTVSLHMALWLGNDDMPRLERLYAEGKITNAEAAVADARFYRNRARADACAQLSSIPIINGVPEAARWLRQRGFLLIIATITSRFAAEFIQKRYGFDAASGCVLQENNGLFTGEVARHFDARDKANFVADFAQAQGVDQARVIAVGDSTSDLPMLEFAGLSIALNASENARLAADQVVDTDDLQDIIPIIDSYFTQSPVTT